MNSLWNYNFTAYVAGMAFSVAGNAITTLALAALLFEQTGKTTDIALVLGIGALASLAGPFAGKLIDKSNIRLLLGGVDFARGLTLFLFLLALSAFGAKPWLVYAFAAALSLMGTVYRPSTGAFLPRLVGRANLVRANSALGSVYSSIEIAGYFAGGVLIVLVGARNALAIDAATFLLMGLVFLSLRENQLHEPATAADDGADIRPIPQRAVIGLMAREGILIIPAVIVAAALVLAPYRVEWPLLLTSFQGGLFFALASAGSVGTSLIVYRWHEKVLNRGAIVASLALLPLLAGLPLLTTNAWALLATGLATGLVTSFAGTTTYSALQALMPGPMRGRIFGLMEPMEKLPLFFMYLLVAGLSRGTDYRIAFLVCALGAAILVLIIGLLVLKLGVVERARATLKP